jgi:hypothetical protein
MRDVYLSMYTHTLCEDTLRTQCVVSIYLYTYTYTLCVRETCLYDALLSRGMEVEIAWEDAER